MEQVSPALLLAAVVLISLGLYGLWRGELSVGPENGMPEEDVAIRGAKARLVSLVVLVAGGLLPFNLAAALSLVLASVVLAWLLSR